MNILKFRKYLLTQYTIGGIIAALLFTLVFLVFNYLDSSIKINNLALKDLSTIQDSILQIKNQFSSFKNEESLTSRKLLKRKLDKQFSDLKNNSYLRELNFNNNIISIDNFKPIFNELKREIQNITISYRILSAEDKINLQAQYYSQIEKNIQNINYSLNQLTLLIVNNLHNQVSNFSKYNILIWLASMISLHLIIIFIFKPTTQKITSVLDDLNKEKEAAETVAKAKSDYLASLSYQIRTPLNSVLGLSDLLLETKINKEQREYLELVRDSGKNLLQVISDIFDYSSIESGNLELEESYFSLEQCLKEVVNLHLPRCREKNLELIYIIEHDVPQYIFGDSRRLAQCFSNLLTNAITYTRKGEIIVRVNLLSGYEDINEIQFAISDTGIGIPEAKLKT